VSALTAGHIAVDGHIAVAHALNVTALQIEALLAGTMLMNLTAMCNAG